MLSRAALTISLLAPRCDSWTESGRTAAGLRDGIAPLMWASADALGALGGGKQLVHGDFNKRNLLVRENAGHWAVAEVLDWEFAVSGSPLTDLGNVLRYELAGRRLADPHFSDGFLRGGGRLPDDWRRLAKLVDLAALCESLTHDHLPSSVEQELVEIVRSTVETRDPKIM